MTPPDNGVEDPTPDSNRKLLKDFSNWLHCPEGGNVSQKTSDTYASCIRRIIIFIGSIQLFSETFQRIGQESFLNDLKISASSLMPWFCALRKFIKFIMKKNLLGVDRGRAAEMTEDVNTWSKAFQRQAKVDHHICQERDAELCPKVLESVTAALYGDNQGVIKDILAKESPLIKREFEITRDYLALRLIAENGQRIGVAINAQTAEWVERIENADESCTFKVQDHKTTSTHGSSVLFCAKDLSGMFIKYKEHLDECVTTVHLFPRWCGTKQHGGLLSQQIKKLCDNTDVTITRLRKATVTSAQTQGATERQMQDLASSMNHTRMVAIRHYDVRRRESLAQSSAQLIINQLRPSPI